MTYSQSEQKKFWEIFEDKLVESGNPFSICYEMGGEVRFFASVNKKRAWVALGLCLDFLCREKVVKINIYIENDIGLFNYLYSKKDQLENELGFKPEWILCGRKNPNTRRIITKFPIIIGDPNNYKHVIEKVIPYVVRYKTVFAKYIPSLFDF